MNEQFEFLKMIVERLDRGQVPYMVTGSVALSFYAEPRMTRDIDIVVEYRPEDSARFQQFFEDICVVDEAMIKDAADNKSMFNIIHREWIVKADFIARKRGRFWEMEFSRRQQLDLEGVSVWVVSPEDLILSKLEWGKDSASELQMRDVRSLTGSVEGLDWAYLKEWATHLGISKLLEEAMGG